MEKWKLITFSFHLAHRYCTWIGARYLFSTKINEHKGHLNSFDDYSFWLVLLWNVDLSLALLKKFVKLVSFFITDISQYIQKYRKEYNEPYVYIIQFNQFVNSWPILFSFSVSLYYFKEISDITSFYFKELFLLFSSFCSLHCDVDSDIFAYLQTCLHNCLFESCLGARYIGMLYCIFAIFLFFNCTLFTHEDGSPNMIRFGHWRKRI